MSVYAKDQYELAQKQKDFAHQLNPRPTLSESQTDVPPAVETAQAIRECILMANALLEELINGPQAEKSDGMIPIQLGLLGTLGQAYSAARLLSKTAKTCPSCGYKF